MRLDTKEKRLAWRYIPANPTIIDDGYCIVYEYEDVRGRICALGYRGTSSKAAFHLSYKTKERRREAVNEWRFAEAERQDRKEQRKIARKAFKHGYEIGDILDGSWGYEQTNWSYYQVVAKTDKTVTLREIASTKDYYAHEQYNSNPVKDRFIGEPKLHRVSPGYGEGSKGWVNINSYLGVSEWDGKTNQGTSWY